MSEPDNSNKMSPDPPGELTAAMQRAVGGHENPSPEQLLGAAAALLKKVLTTNCESRSSALDLLTVDALTTRAMELAAGDPGLRERVPEMAIRTLMAHAKTPG